MCGLVGLYRTSGIDDEADTERLLVTMRDRIIHRGPDDAGLWIDAPGGAVLGFRRLSIIDISHAGHQPMLSADGRYAVVMNGELYNFAEIRAEIEAVSGRCSWRGHSDTEILVEAIALWGFEPAIRRTNGMFAIAAWDRRERVIWLARDRIGKKPLYYGWAGRDFVFASELKALWPHPSFDFQIDSVSLSQYMQLGYVLGDRTIFRGMNKLPNGHILKLDQRGAMQRVTPLPKPYWCLRDAALRGLDEQASGRSATVEDFDALAQDAVRIRMVADVPVGSFLSGGIDSSLVTALMAANSPQPIRSFSIGFHVEGRDEAPYALAVAKHLRTQHQELYVSEADVIKAAMDLPAVYDEPFADDSAIPTLLLCRMARRDVTVALSGDGGDELFAGYHRYALAEKWLTRRGAIPDFACSLSRNLLSSIAQPLSRQWGSQHMERRFELLRRLLADDRPEAFNETIMSQVFNPQQLIAMDAVPNNPLANDVYSLGRSSPIDRMTFMDLGSYLIDDILMKVDRASMATSLEVRCPLLDYRIIEQSWRFPTRDKINGAQGKLPLRNVLYKHVPRSLVDRPKMGFGAPVEVWLRNELRDWAEGLMSHQALSEHGLLNVAACRRLWTDFISGGRGWHRGIWHVIMFQAWYEAMRSVTQVVAPPVAFPFHVMAQYETAPTDDRTEIAYSVPS